MWNWTEGTDFESFALREWSKEDLKILMVESMNLFLIVMEILRKISLKGGVEGKIFIF